MSSAIDHVKARNRARVAAYFARLNAMGIALAPRKQPSVADKMVHFMRCMAGELW